MKYCDVCSEWLPRNFFYSAKNGKFLDTSYRIFNEQKVHKSRVDDFVAGSFEKEHLDECSPMRLVSVVLITYSYSYESLNVRLVDCSG